MDKNKNIEQNQNGKKERKIFFFSWLRRNIYLIFLILLFVVISSLIGVITLTKTDWFKEWAREQALSAINSGLAEDALFSFSDIEFKNLIEANLREAAITVKSDTAIACETISAVFEIKPLFSKRFIINKIVLDGAKVKIRKSKDGVINLSQIAKPSTDTTKGEPPEWLVNLEKLKIKNGSLSFYDSTAAVKKTKSFDDKHLSLRNLNLDLNAKLRLSPTKYFVKINNLDFKETRSGFALNHLAFVLKADTQRVQIQDLTMETPRSIITSALELKETNVFSQDSDIDNSKIDLQLKANPISSADIERFSPEAKEISGDFYVDAQISGSPKEILFKIKNFSFGSTHFSAKGKLKNPGDTLNYAYDINLNNASIKRRDLINTFAQLTSESIPNFGEIKIPFVSLTYASESVASKFKLVNRQGSVSGKANAHLKKPVTYDVSLKTKNLDFSKLTGDAALKSSLNSRISLKGEGSDPLKLKFRLKMNADASKFSSFKIDSSEIKINADGSGNLNIEKIKSYFASGGSLNLDGGIALDDLNAPDYNLFANINNIRLASILNEKQAPKVVSSSLKVKGKGLSIANIQSEIKMKIDELVYNGRNLKPGTVEIYIKNKKNQNSIKITSNFLNLELTGSGELADLSTALAENADYIQKELYTKIEGEKKDTTVETKKIKEKPKKTPYKPFDYKLKIGLKDSEIIASVLKFDELSADLSLDANYVSADSIFDFTVNNIKINEFNYKQNGKGLNVRPLAVSLGYSINKKADSEKLDKLFVGLKGKKIQLDDLTLSKPNLSLNLSGDSINYQISAVFKDILYLAIQGEGSSSSGRTNLALNELKINYLEKFALKSVSPAKLVYDKGDAEIENLKLSGDLGALEINGKYKNESFERATVKIKEYSLDSAKTILPFENELLTMMGGKLDSIEVVADGGIDNLSLRAFASLSDLAMNGSEIGRLRMNLNAEDGSIDGFLSLKSQTDKNRQLTLSVKKLPFEISPQFEGERLKENEPISFSFSGKKLPLELLSPFAAGVKNLKGYADASFSVEGKELKSINYRGSINLKNSNFLLEANNMDYSANGYVLFKTDTVFVRNLTLENNPSDLIDGKAKVKGYCVFEGFDLKKFDFEAHSKQIKVMSRSSMKATPSLYGNFTISFGPEPLHMYGSLTEPYVRGDINVEKAALTMPASNGGDFQKTRLVYKTINKKQVELEFVKDSSQTEPKISSKGEENGGGFAENLDIETDIRFLGGFVVTMEITGIGQLIAEIGTSNPNEPLRFVQERGAEQPRLYGTDLLVKDGSTIKLIKMLETKGKISFPTGSIENPTLDLTAAYRGQRFLADKVSYFTVKMNITGTKEKPKVNLTYSIDDIEATGDSTKISENALLLLAIGRTKEEMGQSESGSFDMSSATSSVASAATSAAVSTALTDFVQGTGFIKSADIDIGSSLTDLDQAKMKFSGEIQGIRWTLGGTVAEFSGNNEITIDMPMPFWRNVILQITKATSSAPASAARNQKDWEVKLRLRTSW